MILATGGIDNVSDTAVAGIPAVVAGFTIFVLIPAGVILLLCVRGRVDEEKDSPDVAGASVVA